MSSDDDLFSDALEQPPDQRSAWLDRACAGDPDQRARIDGLLAAIASAGDFLAVMPVARPAAPAEEKPGDTIGHYTLVAKLGEGGFGTVYLAEQKFPVRRRVALKIIKLGMDTRAVIARFEGERQALALMDHPDIARVFDAGATETGRPFFVMEHVAGAPITKFCDEHQLPLAARLELFARVCLALQHAHQKGIIHRDIKPSNILVAQHDGTPWPKVIDFGIAKATQDRLTDHTLVTGVDQFMGTPAYMSPEQAEHRDGDIDTRSDIYALGVLLYELISGHLPFEAKSLARVGVDEIRRRIRELEPPRPSARVAALPAAERATVARLRGASPAQLAATLRGDLDWIVVRCLEKDRARRYGTAQELAEDIRRHLRREPVDARPPSRAYRAGRFISRHRVACASAAAIAFTLIAGTVVSVRQAIRATHAEHTAAAERDVANLARTDAQRRQQEAEGLLTFMLGDFRTELQKIGRLQLLDRVGEKALAYFAALNPRDLTDTALAVQAKALTQMGEIRMDEARYTDAATAFTTAYRRAAALADRHPKNADMLFERAQAEYWIGFVGRRRGDFAAEREWFTRYRDSALALAALEGKTLRAQNEVAYGQHNLAVLESDDGHLAAARTGFLAERAEIEAMLAANSGDTELLSRVADIASWLGNIAERNGDYRQALAHYSEMCSRYDDLANRQSSVANWRFELASGRIFKGNVQMLLGHLDEAEAAFSDAMPVLEHLVGQDQKNRNWQVKLLYLRLQQAAIHFAKAKFSTAASVLTDVRTKLDERAAAEPSSRVFLRLLTAACRWESLIRLTTHDGDAASAVSRAFNFGQTLVNEPRAENWVVGEFAQTCILSGRIAYAEGQFESARRKWQLALDIVAPRLTESNDWRFLDPAAQALVLLGRGAEARPLVDRLRHFGYHSLDPLAASILEAAPSPASSPETH